MNLVLQGAGIGPGDAQHLAASTGAASVEQLAAMAGRLRSSTRSDAINAEVAA